MINVVMHKGVSAFAFLSICIHFIYFIFYVCNLKWKKGKKSENFFQLNQSFIFLNMSFILMLQSLVLSLILPIIIESVDYLPNNCLTTVSSNLRKHLTHGKIEMNLKQIVNNRKTPLYPLKRNFLYLKSEVTNLNFFPDYFSNYFSNFKLIHLNCL